MTNKELIAALREGLEMPRGVSDDYPEFERVKDLMDQAAQALEAQEWRDIESAPKDGTRVLLFVPPYGPSTGHFEDSSLSVPHWVMHSVLNKEANPTHWKPLDTPPETE